jgi:hypothetical protein
MLFLGRTTIRVRGLKSNTTETAVVEKPAEEADDHGHGHGHGHHH